MIEKKDRILITGRYGLVGTALERQLRNAGYENIIGCHSTEVDFSNQKESWVYFNKEKPDYVFHAAAKVGGIMANSLAPADFLYKNLMIQNNVIHCAHEFGVKKMIFVGSSCVYPRDAKQPMDEQQIMSGKLDPANEGYALAKLAGMKLCQFYNKQYNDLFITLLPCNLYGVGDRFDYKTAHVVAATIRKVHDAKIANKSFIEVWGTGNARRELMFSDDFAKACIFFLENDFQDDVFNVGVGLDYSIKDIVLTVMKALDYFCDIHFDISKPDGTPQRMVDITKTLMYGWRAETSLLDGIKKMYCNFLEHENEYITD